MIINPKASYYCDLTEPRKVVRVSNWVGNGAIGCVVLEVERFW